MPNHFNQITEVILFDTKQYLRGASLAFLFVVGCSASAQSYNNYPGCPPAAMRAKSHFWSCPSFFIHRGTLNSPSIFPENRPQCDIPDSAGVTIGIKGAGDVEPKAELSISGYVHLSLIYDRNKDNINDFFAPVLLTPGNNNPHARFYARESRFRIKSNFCTPIGKIATIIESDFFSDTMASEVLTTSDTLRLRIARGDWFFCPNWALSVGQDYSTFVNFFAFPKTVEFNGPVGTSQIRQALVRLTYEQERYVFSISAENPETTVFTTIGGPIASNQICFESGNNPIGVNDEVPDFCFRAEYSTPEELAKFQLSGVLRKHIAGSTKGGGAGNGYTVGDRATGYGLLGALKLSPSKYFALTAMVVGGDGIGRYLYDIGYGQAAIFHSDQGTISTVHAWGASGSVIINPTETLSINVAGGLSRARRSDLIENAALKDDIYYVNLFWSPVKQLQFGIEWSRGKLYRIGDHPTTAYRYQASARVYF